MLSARFSISDESTNVQRFSRVPTGPVSVTAGAPLANIACYDPPAPSSRNGTGQSIPVAWGRDMQSLSPFLLSYRDDSRGYHRRLAARSPPSHKYRCEQARQARLAPTRSFVRKISERLKSNFFFLVPARLLTRPTILEPGPYQSGIACPGNASLLLLPYRFRPWTSSPDGYITHCQPQDQAEHQQLSLFGRWQHRAKSRDEHDAHDALLDPLGPIRPICIATGRLMCIGSASSPCPATSWIQHSRGSAYLVFSGRTARQENRRVCSVRPSLYPSWERRR